MDRVLVQRSWSRVLCDERGSGSAFVGARCRAELGTTDSGAELPQAQVSGRVVEQIADVTVPLVMQMDSLVRQTTKEIGVGVQLVLSKRMQERVGDGNIKDLDKYNKSRAGAVSDKIKAVEHVLAGRAEAGFIKKHSGRWCARSASSWTCQEDLPYTGKTPSQSWTRLALATS